jgi:hypothetical protein
MNELVKMLTACQRKSTTWLARPTLDLKAQVDASMDHEHRWQHGSERFLWLLYAAFLNFSLSFVGVDRI